MLFGTQFNFYSPYSIDECVEMLLARSERPKAPYQWNSNNKLLITVDPEGSDCYSFRFHRDAGRNLHAEVIGRLASDGISTHVSGRARIGLFTLAGLTFFAVFWSPVVVIFFQAGVPFLGIFVITGLGILTLSTISERERLGKLACEILGKSKEK
jgi:hypothetical protein